MEKGFETVDVGRLSEIYVGTVSPIVYFIIGGAAINERSQLLTSSRAA